jgi:hypothetical protein
MPPQSRPSQATSSRPSLIPKDVAILPIPKPEIANRIRPRWRKANALRREVTVRTEALQRHRYFELCRSKHISRPQMMEIIEQLYCFSVFFERLLTLRVARYTSNMDHRVLSMARSHLREEFGHAGLFLQCLVENGMSQEDARRIQPKMFTRALYGYLTSVINHENEYVANVAIMQAMESLGYLFFTATLPVMRHHKMASVAMEQHSADDEEHSKLGIEFAEEFDDETLTRSLATIADLYRLMGFVLDEWLGRP